MRNRNLTAVPAILIILLPGWMAAPDRSNRRAKRIAFGEPVPSLDTYGLHHFVMFRRHWGCLSDQTDHEGSLGRCQDDRGRCGGALIHPEFVLTAAHCLQYWQVYVIDKENTAAHQDLWVQILNARKSSPESAVFGAAEIWEKLQKAITTYFIVPKPKHAVYNEWAMLMGSHDANKMTQKRHAVRMFPHRGYPKIGEIPELGGLDWDTWEKQENSWHDIGLVRACQPFNIKPGEVGLAPMVKTHTDAKEQYERIVRSSKVCLYAGFGVQDNLQKDALKAGYPRFSTDLMLHTWRYAVCYSKCNNVELAKPEDEHACTMCSAHIGPKLGMTGSGDSGTPVHCEGQYVATHNRGAFIARRNYSGSDSYPLHCVVNAISPKNLEYYKTIPHNTSPLDYHYHPLRDTRHRRWPPHTPD